VQQKFNEIVGMLHETQIMGAVIFGMCVQFFIGKSKTAKVALTIVVSSLFVALYIVPVIVEIVGVPDTSKIAISLYALSSLISVELLAVLITLLPGAIRRKTLDTLGIKDVS